jgi:hypothetical protein
MPREKEEEFERGILIKDSGLAYEWRFKTGYSLKL